MRYLGRVLRGDPVGIVPAAVFYYKDLSCIWLGFQESNNLVEGRREAVRLIISWDDQGKKNAILHTRCLAVGVNRRRPLQSGGKSPAG